MKPWVVMMLTLRADGSIDGDAAHAGDDLRRLRRAQRNAHAWRLLAHYGVEIIEAGYPSNPIDVKAGTAGLELLRKVFTIPMADVWPYVKVRNGDD